MICVNCNNKLDIVFLHVIQDSYYAQACVFLCQLCTKNLENTVMTVFGLRTRILISRNRMNFSRQVTGDLSQTEYTE